MFKTITALATIPVGFTQLALESRRYQKEAKARVAKREEYNEMIAASQQKLAKTTLVPGFTNVYA